MSGAPNVINNKTGRGGFGDHPEHRANGRWSKENSFSYWMNKFKSMTTAEFLEWVNKNPQKKRTVASDLAYVRVLNARKDLKEFQEVANRTEGTPVQNIDPDGGGQPIHVILYKPKK